MDKDDTFSLYEQIDQYISQFSYDFIDGVTIELEEFLDHEVEEYEFNFDVEKKRYKIVAPVDTFNQADVHIVFMSLLHFIGYRGADIYARKVMGDRIHYLLASLREDGTGFCCEIDFKPSSEASRTTTSSRLLSTWGPFRGPSDEEDDEESE